MKKIPIGVDDFKKIRKENYFYIDKTLLIKEILDNGSEVKLITRPRRFGKTLNLSMLQHFFEKGADPNLFQGLAIERAGENYLSYLGKYPVIFLTLKSAKQPSWELAYEQIVDCIVREFQRQIKILDSDKLLVTERESYTQIIEEKSSRVKYMNSLYFLSNCLEKVYGEKVVILIDEYDVPLENAYFNGFYDEMISFIRSLFESALKTNSSLQFAVLTGCLRISRESIFTGLNNLSIFSIRKNMFSQYFGFTEQEVEQFLIDYHLFDQLPEVKQWYDGYLFGKTEVYNPWSIINYVQDKVQEEITPIAYWSNTSGNHIIRSLLEKIDEGGKAEIETLIAGGSIEKSIHEDMTYQEIYNSTNNVWNFLYFTGYLTKVTEKREGFTDYVTLRIPNDEIGSIFENQIRGWFQERIKESNLDALYQAILTGENQIVQNNLNDLLEDSISFMDQYENFYHGFLIGVLSGITAKGYRVLSNRESGNGRGDIFLQPTNSQRVAIIIEVKATKEWKAMEELCHAALNQIETKGYDKELQMNGCSGIYHYGITFFQKECKVLNEKVK